MMNFDEESYGVKLPDIREWFDTKYADEIEVDDVVKVQRHCDEKTSFWLLTDELRWMLGYKVGQYKRLVPVVNRFTTEYIVKFS